MTDHGDLLLSSYEIQAHRISIFNCRHRWVLGCSFADSAQGAESEQRIGRVLYRRCLC